MSIRIPFDYFFKYYSIVLELFENVFFFSINSNNMYIFIVLFFVMFQNF